MLDAIFNKDSKQDLEYVINGYIRNQKKRLANDQLNIKEWDQLRTIHKYLSVFFYATLNTEDHNSTLKEVLENLNYIYKFLKNKKIF